MRSEVLSLRNNGSREMVPISRGGGRKFCLEGQILIVAREARAKFLGTRPFNWSSKVTRGDRWCCYCQKPRNGGKCALWSILEATLGSFVGFLMHFVMKVATLWCHYAWILGGQCPPISESGGGGQVPPAPPVPPPMTMMDNRQKQSISRRAAKKLAWFWLRTDRRLLQTGKIDWQVHCFFAYHKARVGVSA